MLIVFKKCSNIGFVIIVKKEEMFCSVGWPYIRLCYMSFIYHYPGRCIAKVGFEIINLSEFPPFRPVSKSVSLSY